MSESPHTSGPAVVAFGGGHGLYASLSALRMLTQNLTAVVTVADDGGSSGRLRDELGVLPPGDLRMALAALCDTGEWGHTWRDVLQHRFHSEGPLDNHAVGNLLIVALWELLEDPVRGLDLVGRLLGVRGRVLPMALSPMQISADVKLAGGQRRRVDGQFNVATTTGIVQGIHLTPPEPVPCAQAINAVNEADWVVMGPGSWFTSVLPHLLVPMNLREVAGATSVPDTGEEAGMTVLDMVHALRDHAPDMRFDAVLADPAAVPDLPAIATAAESFGARLVQRPVRSGAGSLRHDPLRLAAALHDILENEDVR
ncbi:MAG: hypothetical protein CSB46_07750 [Micrococcales bacterium]|nr:MAG: hypothetical protein CSB46_07750 [Micrococcales bacterium]